MSSTMTLTHVQPRRRAARTSDTPANVVQQPSIDIEIAKDLSVRKGVTFHQSKSPSSSPADPVINIKGLPSRSLTCPKSLDILQQESDKLVNDILTSFDRSLSGLGGNVKAKQTLTTPAVDGDVSKANQASTATIQNDDGHTANASVYAPVSKQPTFPSSHVLSEYAAKVIKLHIIDPLLEEETLKDFHPLVKGLPQRIGSQQIKCLRDLEKVIIFLAPHTTKSARSYLDFCETSIQCIVTTVDHLTETDQRRPNDRPYTNNYFVDLVEQVRQYARIMAVSRAKQAKGLPLDDSDIQPGEKVLLRGGVAEDGKPIELVREVDGKFVPIPAEHMDLEDVMFDDDVNRSMARKRKCDIGKVEYRACRECGKVYTRPCDLTKHEKTHSRPWKCSEPGCKYFEFGWPTEKERDRHMNDKHSSAPALYHCLWKEEGCTYTSKRESNCKQHMEKAHGWDYIRSKSKKGTKLVPTVVPGPAASSPTVSLMPTPPSERLSTPALTASSNQSPAPSTFDAFSVDETGSTGYQRGGSMSSYHPTVSDLSPAASEPVFSFNDYSKEFSYDMLSPSTSDGQNDRIEHILPDNFSKTSPAINMNMAAPTFEQEFNFDNVNADWTALGSIFPQYQIPQQQPTPSGSDYNLGFNSHSPESTGQSVNSEFSPGATSNAMLFGNEDVMMEESQGFVDFAAQAKLGQSQVAAPDFTLFGEVGSGLTSADTAAAMFPDLGENGHFEQEMNASMFDQMSEEEMDRYLYGDGN